MKITISISVVGKDHSSCPFSCTNSWQGVADDLCDGVTELISDQANAIEKSFGVSFETNRKLNRKAAELEKLTGLAVNKQRLRDQPGYEEALKRVGARLNE